MRTYNSDSATLPCTSNIHYTNWDVVIIGAGPAGSIAGLNLARSGRKVLLLDQHEFPRDKVCGDALIPDALSCLMRNNLLEEVDRKALSVPSLSVYSPHQYHVDLPGQFKTIKRVHFDQILVRAALDAGAKFAQGKVKNVSPGESAQIEIEGMDDPLKADIAIIATGADVSLLKPLGALSDPKANATAMRCYIKADVDIEQIIISFDQSIIPGYAWIFPMRDGEFNIGCGFFYGSRGVSEKINLKTLYQKFITEFPLAREVVEKGEMTSPLKGARLRCGLTGTRSRVNQNVIFIGETIGTTFPFTGEGIGKAMETGEIASEVIHKTLSSGRISELLTFDRSMETQLKPKYKGYHIAENWLSHAWLNDFLIKRARKSAYLREAAAGVISETIDPESIFSIRGIAKSLFK